MNDTVTGTNRLYLFLPIIPVNHRHWIHISNVISAENVVNPTVMSTICGERVWCVSTGTSTHWVEGGVPEGAVPMARGHLQWGPNGVFELKRFLKVNSSEASWKKQLRNSFLESKRTFVHSYSWF